MPPNTDESLIDDVPGTGERVAVLPDRRREIRIAKLRATGLLVVVAAAFVVVVLTTDDRGGGGYLRAGLEAAMVGGLADWFAVVAIFRRPLGLPIRTPR